MYPLSPTYLRLRDGSEWLVRSGGTWDGRDDGYVGAYSCVKECASVSEVILERESEPVNMSDDSWTVLVGPLGDGQALPAPETRVVETAWFIASTMPAPGTG